ncbi:MAG: DUF262 domain-containing protein [Treponema sp.]|nr:DUF262 domain-containing protein [Treponema sp.]
MTRDPLIPNLWNIRQLYENKMFEIPVYQRPYSWDAENVTILLNDILNSFNERKTVKSYYTGNVIIRENDTKTDGNIKAYDIIDGQQRITTFTLILLCLHSLFARNCTNQNDPIIFDVKRLLWQHSATRYPEKEFPSLKLNSIEKEAFSVVYDYAFDKPKELYKFASNYECKSDYEKRVIENFKLVYNTLQETVCENENNLLDYASYVIEHINFINIECTEHVNKVFSIFESINSKGKPLEEIDKIKCYIFSELDEDSYKLCLRQWGDLIIKTKDNLYDYLMVYIRAYIKYYRQNITLINFKTIAYEEMKRHFNKDNLCDTFKALLEDMVSKVKYYNMLSDIEELKKLYDNHKLRMYFRLFAGYYKHPKPLFFRTFIDFANNKISGEDFVEIFVTITNFMIESLTLLSRDSKDVITMFSKILSTIYDNGIQLSTIKYFVAKESVKSNITKDLLQYSIINYDAYSHKNISVPLLALYEAYNETTGKVSYDQADVLTSKFSESFSLDHLLVQTPEPDDDEYKYYCNFEDGYETLCLKPGSDFPEKIQNGMPYDDFRSQVLNKFGNMRIYYRDKNSSRQNNAIELKEYGKFTKYSDITDREKEIVSFLIENILTIPTVNQSDEPKKTKKSPTKLPKMDELINAGLISIGDKIYLTVSPEDSEATLTSPTTVDYKGQSMTLNQWGQTVTGWTSIQIYRYVCVSGETETLNDKRTALSDENLE